MVKRIAQDGNLNSLIEKARKHKITPEEGREQEINSVVGNLFDALDPPPTRREICKILNLSSRRDKVGQVRNRVR